MRFCELTGSYEQPFLLAALYPSPHGPYSRAEPRGCVRRRGGGGEPRSDWDYGIPVSVGTPLQPRKPWYTHQRTVALAGIEVTPVAGAPVCPSEQRQGSSREDLGSSLKSNLLSYTMSSTHVKITRHEMEEDKISENPRKQQF